MLLRMIISIDNYFKFNAMPAKITFKNYYGSAVLLDKICLISSSQFYSYHFARVKALINDTELKLKQQNARDIAPFGLREIV